MPLKQHNNHPDRVIRHLGETGLSEFVTYLQSPWRIIWVNLLAGVARGLGFVLGATVVLGSAVYILVNWLGSLPWVGQVFQHAGVFLQQLQVVSDSLMMIQ